MRESDEIDRAAWARLLGELLAGAGMTPEQATQPGGPLTTNWRTIRRWLSEDQGVSARSVRDVSRDLGYPPLDALVRVGFLTREEARLPRGPVTPRPPLPQPLRAIADVLTDKRVPEGAKSTLQRGVQAAFDLWVDMHNLRAPRERPVRDRTLPPTGQSPV